MEYKQIEAIEVADIVIFPPRLLRWLNMVTDGYTIKISAMDPYELFIASETEAGERDSMVRFYKIAIGDRHFIYFQEFFSEARSEFHVSVLASFFNLQEDRE